MRSVLGGIALVAASWALCACSVRNLNYRMVVQDIDAAVVVEGEGAEERLVYRDTVDATWGIARWSLLVPFRWPLFLLFGERVTRELENPSQYVRELAGELAPKSGTRLDRACASTQRLVRIAELDPSPLNRITALTGLARLASERELSLADGVAEFGPKPVLLADAPRWRDDFARLRPAARQPIGAELSPSDAEVYRSAIAGLVSAPLPEWRQRLALLSDLENAAAEEGDRELRASTRTALELALGHALRVSVVQASLGRDRELLEVRICAVELLHRSAGADSVPLLLALLAASPQQIEAGEPQFEDNESMRLRLVHLCGQLDEARALRAVRIRGRESWQEVAPAEYLARLALDGDPYFSPTALPAREALAFCLQRRSAVPAPDAEAGADWVAEWWNEYRKQRPLK